MSFGDASATLRQTLRQACRDLEECLRAGKPCRAEDILTSYPELNHSPDHAVDVILAEFQIRRHLGEDPEPEEFLERFPQFREQLTEFFEEFERSASEDTALGEPGEAPPGEDDGFPFPLTLAMEDGPDWKVVHYEVLGDLPNAGVVAVYKARHLPNGGLVALKILPKVFTHPDEIARFRRGRDDQARLKHPNIVAVYDKGENKEAIYFAMEFGEAGTLADRIGDRPMPADETARIMHALAEAMDYAHAQKIIHRDLKPANVVLTADGTPKITDFGLARRQEPETVQSHATIPGDLHGTPAYMAPEQTWADSQYVSERTDVFGLGAVFYQMLTGRVPFEGANLVETVLKVRNQPAVFPRRHHRAVDRRLESVCLKCLEKKPRRRYPSVTAFRNDLECWQRGKQPRANGPAARGLRFARRHAYALSASFLPLLVVAVIVVANHLRSPEWYLARLQAELERGNEVTLIDRVGPPRWFEHDPALAWVSTFEDEPFTVDSRGYARVVLLPHFAHPYYEFSAEIRHDSSQAERESKMGAVGFFVNYGRTPEDRTVHRYVEALFQGIINEGKTRDGVWKNELRLDAVCFRSGIRGPYMLRNLLFPVSVPPSRTWRTLTLRVLPEGTWIEITSPDGAEERYVHEMDRKMEGYRKRNGIAPTEDPFPGRALGISVRLGQAAFRNVKLKPLRVHGIPGNLKSTGDET